MALFRVLYVDGRKDEVSTTMGDAIAAERRGTDLSKSPIEGGMRTVFAALARVEERPPSWREFDHWSSTVDSIEGDSGGENGPDPTQEDPPDTR